MVRESEGSLTIDIHVVPRSSKTRLLKTEEGLKACLNAPPVDGQANRALIELLSEVFHLPVRAISIIRGESGRKKTVRLTGATKEQWNHLPE